MWESREVFVISHAKTIKTFISKELSFKTAYMSHLNAFLDGSHCLSRVWQYFLQLGDEKQWLNVTFDLITFDSLQLHIHGKFEREITFHFQN